MVSFACLSVSEILRDLNEKDGLPPPEYSIVLLQLALVFMVQDRECTEECSMEQYRLWSHREPVHETPSASAAGTTIVLGLRMSG